MRRDRLGTAILVLGGLLALAAAVIGLLVGLGEDWESRGARVLWLVLTLGGAALLASSLWYASRAPTVTAAALIVIGALICGFVIFWSIVMPIAAIALAVMTIMWARRPRVA